MRKNKLFLIMMIMALLSVGLVSAALVTTIQSPTASAYPGGSYTFSINTTGHGKLANCTMALTSTATANTSVTLFTQQENDSTNTDIVNITYDTTNLEDGAYSVTGTCWNSSDNSDAADAVSINIDNTQPQAPSSLTTTTQTTDDYTLSSTVVGANTTSCSIAFIGGNPYPGAAPTITHSSNTCSISITDSTEGTFRYTFTASDGTNSSSASAETEYIVKLNERTNKGSSVKPVVVAETVADKAKERVSVIKAFFSKIKAWFKGLFS